MFGLMTRSGLLLVIACLDGLDTCSMCLNMLRILVDLLEYFGQ